MATLPALARSLILFVGVGMALPVWAQSDHDLTARAVAEEEVLLETREKILDGDFRYDGKVSADAVLQTIDDLTLDADAELRGHLLNALDQLERADLDLAARLRLEVVRAGIAPRSGGETLKARYFFKALFGQLDKKSALTLLSHPEVFDDTAWKSLRRWTESRYPRWAALVEGEIKAAGAAVTADMIRDLFQFEPATDKYAGGRYHNKPRLYMFCRTNRNYPCLMVMRDGQGEIWRDANGDIWSQPALALSRHNKPATKVNGHTPAGVQRIDGVMPKADQQLVYGKFRRLILNFVGDSENEELTKLLLPQSSHDSTWWQQASVARDVGRSALRIHGTGLSSSRSKPYYPLVPTSGCIAKRENKYDGVTYKDQRLLLDELMKAQGLDPVYENETAIRALLYLIEIDSKNAPVQMADLKGLGLF